MKKFFKNIIRSFLWRLSRKIYMAVRKESFYDQANNGEFWLIDLLIKELPKSKKSYFFDIGSFKGEWSLYVSRKLLKQNLHKSKVFAFEPASSTFQKLIKIFKNINNIDLSQLAFTNKDGKQNFFVYGDLMGNNSLIPDEKAIIEQVKTLTFDAYIKEKKLRHIRLIKSDTEGHDYKVILGAQNAFQKEMIDVWQFEYNHRWIYDKCFLKDLFVFLEDKNYTLGKLCNDNIEIYDQWHMELEKFFEANYVIIHNKFLEKKFCSKVKFNENNVLENE